MIYIHPTGSVLQRTLTKHYVILFKRQKYKTVVTKNRPAAKRAQGQNKAGPCITSLQSPLGCKEIQPVHPKGDQSSVLTGRTDAEAETPILWPPDAKNVLIGKEPDAGKIEGRRRRGRQRVRRLDGLTDLMDTSLSKLHNGVITHLEPDILECEVKWALGSITANKASGGDRIPAELF